MIKIRRKIKKCPQMCCRLYVYRIYSMQDYPGDPFFGKRPYQANEENIFESAEQSLTYQDTSKLKHLEETYQLDMGDTR